MFNTCLENYRPDPRKQLLVYKMVPRLHANVMTRQQLFLKNYTAANPVNPNGVTSSTQRPLLPENLSNVETVRDRIVDKIHLYSPEEKLSLSVEYERSVLVTTFSIGDNISAAILIVCLFLQWSF